VQEEKKEIIKLRLKKEKNQLEFVAIFLEGRKQVIK
jgi:hypothetical protein